MPRRVTFKEVGPPNTPQEIKRLRRENMDICRRMGQPIITRHIYGLKDVEEGIAKQCPACYDPAYKQVRGDCPVCYGYGFVSVANNPQALYIDSDGQVTSEPTATPAPQYGGFAVPYLTWLIEPDVAVDVFRINERGVLVQQFDAQGVAPWFPTLGDNDLCVNVKLRPDGFTVEEELDRFQLKKVQQVTIRGFGRLGRASANGQPYLVAQTFEMNKSPDNLHLRDVPIDAAWY